MDNFFSLDKGQKNKSYKIIKVTGDDKIKRRLLDLGFVNCNIKILKTSALRQVFLVEIRGFLLAIKRTELSRVLVCNA